MVSLTLITKKVNIPGQLDEGCIKIHSILPDMNIYAGGNSKSLTLYLLSAGSQAMTNCAKS